jgi:glycosyltransferase involved in cell wall biosynthesis
MLSVIIPSRDSRWLQRTVDDLLLKAEGEVEVIVILDGYWPEPMINVEDRTRVIHQNYKGMREAINSGMSLASGEYVMKIDEHCMMDKGYDVKLIGDCPDRTVVVPRRYRLDAEKWEIIDDGRKPIDYMFVDYPYYKEFDSTQGLHGAEWEKDGPEIDDLMTMQGSCYFLKKSYWEELGDMNTELYGPFTHEAQEISFKAWLGGGQVKVNKKTWYAHLHKGKRYGTGYGFSTQGWIDFKANMEKGRQACLDYWLNNKWDKRVHDFEWMIDKFSPVPHWPDNWGERLVTDKDKDWSKLGESTWQP